MAGPDALPVVSSMADADRHEGEEVVVEGVYEQQDVRMKRSNPDELFDGRAAVVLDDGVPVFLHPPQDDEARRSAEEIERFEHRAVRATGLLLATNPRDGAVIMAPCLIDIRSIEAADEA